MAYGEGRTRLYRDIGQEEASERGRYEREVTAAEEAYEEDVVGSTLWSTLGSVLTTAGMAAFGSKDFDSLSKAWALGGEGGKWMHRGFSGYDPEDYAVTTDPGTFGVSQRYDFEDVNRQFEEANRTRFWKDITGTGTTVATMLALGGGVEEEETGMDLWNRFSKQAKGVQGTPVSPYTTSIT